MKNLALLLSYDGTDFHGWQSQPGLRTVEDTLKEAIRKILTHEVKIFAAARTDRGVHARAQVINFLTHKNIPKENLLRGLNSLLPKDVRVMEIEEVEEGFHARYSAKSKVYRYFIFNGPVCPPFLSRYSLHLPHKISFERIKEALNLFKGSHDFSAFKKKKALYKNPVRNLINCRVVKKGSLICFEFEAEGFLRYMVRTIVGTLLSVGKGKMEIEEIASVFKSKNRDLAGPTAPPQGLFLWRIDYASKIFSMI